MSALDKNTYYGKISKLARTFNKMDEKHMDTALNEFARNNEKAQEEQER